MIGYDETRQDKARQDKTRQDKTRQGKARQGKHMTTISQPQDNHMISKRTKFKARQDKRIIV